MEMWERFVIAARAKSLALRRDWAMFSDDLTSGYLASKLEDATRAQLDVWQLQWQQQWAYASSRRDRLCGAGPAACASLLYARTHTWEHARLQQAHQLCRARVEAALVSTAAGLAVCQQRLQRLQATGYRLQATGYRVCQQRLQRLQQEFLRLQQRLGACTGQSASQLQTMLHAQHPHKQPPSAQQPAAQQQQHVQQVSISLRLLVAEGGAVHVSGMVPLATFPESSPYDA